MKPVVWTDRDVRLECEHCSAEFVVDLKRFARLVGGQTVCRICGILSTVRDRRLANARVRFERRNESRSINGRSNPATRA
jgi:hypothetical protein